jgi:hypothetical protein
LGHRNIRNTCVDAQITNPLRDHVFRELEHHPKMGRVPERRFQLSPPRRRELWREW